MVIFIEPKRRFVRSPCEKEVNTKRLLSMGAGFEQRPWTPTVRRGKIGAELAGPGPACVNLPALVGVKVPDAKKLSAPAFSFGQKHRRNYETLGPGPAQYNVSGLGAKGKDTPPAATLQSRRKASTKYITPAPGEYNVARSTKAVSDSTPKYSFGQKPPPDKSLHTPAPNVYNIPTLMGASREGPIRSAPAFSITGRFRQRLIPALALPGPGAYDGDYRTVMRKPPMYSMRSKYTQKDPLEEIPGPGAHCPEKYVPLKSGTAPSFGIVHTPYIGVKRPFLIPDNVESRHTKPDWCLKAKYEYLNKIGAKY